MLRYGIPSYRLPRDRLDVDIDVILAAGVTVVKETAAGEGLDLAKMRKEHDALFIAIGAHAEKRLGVEGEDLRGVIPAVKLLRAMGEGDFPDFKGKKVAVVGGGNVAMDAARSALRAGAEKVTLVYRRRREDMTALAEEVDEALAEGCALQALQAPVKIEGNDQDEVTALVTAPQVPGPVEHGRPVPLKAERDPVKIPCDFVIVAIGQETDSKPFAAWGVKTKRELILTGRDGAVEGMAGVFAGGDCVSGPATVIRAIEAGKVAAFNIDRYLGFNHHIESGVKDIPPPPLGDKKLWGRVQADPMTQEEMRQEAGRCLRCDAFGLAALRRN